MRISAVRNYSPMTFTGENSKSGKIKTAAGAAAIALAAAIPAEEADAQIFYPYVPPTHYYVPAPTVRVPDCFVYGDMENFDYSKSMDTVFSEIDGQVKPNRELSVGEVVKMERKNWNLNNIIPYNANQMEAAATRFKLLSEVYNEDGSNPGTISFSEYRKIMQDYMKSQNITNFMILMELLTHPKKHCPIHGPMGPQQHHHHHR